MNELLSIIVPMYNAEDTISTLLYSLHRQSYPNIEVLLIDDGSTDDTGEICRSWCGGDKRFKYFWKENGGVGDARNYGIKMAGGEWVAFPDADDECEERMYEMLMKEIEGCGVSGVICGQIGGRMMVSGEYDWRDEDLFNKPSIGWVGSGVFKKSDLMFPSVNLFEDNLFVYAFLEEVGKILVLPQTLYIHNDTPHSLSKKRWSYGEEWWKNYLEIVRKYIDDYFVDNDYRNRYIKMFKNKIGKLKHEYTC